MAHLGKCISLFSRLTILIGLVVVSVIPVGPRISAQSQADLIFSDSFESGSLSAWSSSNIDGGDLSVNASAALVGSQGLRAVLDDNISIFLTDDIPAAEPRYRARFYFHPNSIVMTSGDTHFIFSGIMGTSTAVLISKFTMSLCVAVRMVRIGS